MSTPYPDETNSLGPEGSSGIVKALDKGGNMRVDWADPRLAKVTRLRLLTDPGFPVWDVSYCIGELRDGRTCRVELPFSQLPKSKVKAAILRYAKDDGVYAKGLGLFNPDVISRLW